MKKDITILLPVHSLEGDYKDMLINAVKSIDDFHNDVILNIICPKSVADQFDFPLTEKLDIKITTNEGNLSLIHI